MKIKEKVKELVTNGGMGDYRTNELMRLLGNLLQVLDEKKLLTNEEIESILGDKTSIKMDTDGNINSQLCFCRDCVHWNGQTQFYGFCSEIEKRVDIQLNSLDKNSTVDVVTENDFGCNLFKRRNI